MGRDDLIRTDFEDADIIRTCLRKKGYPTMEVADNAAALIRREHVGARVVSYACTRCGRYHIGGKRRDETDVDRDWANEDAEPRRLGARREAANRRLGHRDAYIRDRRRPRRGTEDD